MNENKTNNNNRDKHAYDKKKQISYEFYGTGRVDRVLFFAFKKTFILDEQIVKIVACLFCAQFSI